MITPLICYKNGIVGITLLMVLSLIACGDGAETNNIASLSDDSGIDAGNSGIETDNGVEVVSNGVETANNGSQTGDNGVELSDPINAGPETGGVSASSSTFPYSGTFVADEFTPSTFAENAYKGIVEIVPSPLNKTRILNGSMPRRYPDGRTTYRQPCGQRVSQIAIAEPSGTSVPITPCSSTIPNDGASPTDFRQSNLSPDGTKLAVETRIYINSGFSFSTLVFDTSTQAVLAVWSGYNGTWTPDGRLLLASDAGLFLFDANLDNPQQLGDKVTGIVGNPDVDPTGSAIVFEFNQQIWGMNIDGSQARVLVTDGNYLRYPTWAPDGSLSIAYLALPSGDKYLTNIFTTDLSTGQSYALDLAPVLEFGNANYLRTINGPLSWNQ